MAEGEKETQTAAASLEASQKAVNHALGNQIREYRTDQKLTMAQVAACAGISTGNLSRIERGLVSPSMTNLIAIAAALRVPLSALFKKYEQERDCFFVPAGEGLVIDRLGTRAGHEYRLIGQNILSSVKVEPYMITLNDRSEVFPAFQHAGYEFIYMLKGEMVYRHGSKTYPLRPGDSLFFDSDAPHGPEELIEVPVKLVSVMSKSAEDE